MLELHITHKNYSSWSLRPWLLMRQLGVPFAEVLHLLPPAGDWAAVRALSPSGRVPVLVDRERDLLVWDSLAITETLHERLGPEGGVWPTDARARGWARAASAEMHSGFGALRSICSMSCGVRVRLHAIAPSLATDLARLAALFEDGLGRWGGPFLAGARFTAVDAFFAPVAFRAQTFHLDFPPMAAAYLERLRALPDMVAWYRDALAEPWREAGHEADTLAHGVLVADLRAS